MNPILKTYCFLHCLLSFLFCCVITPILGVLAGLEWLTIRKGIVMKAWQDALDIIWNGYDFLSFSYQSLSFNKKQYANEKPIHCEAD